MTSVTGFPTLPEGYFWMVDEVQMSIPKYSLGYYVDVKAVEVSVRRKRWYGSSKVAASKLYDSRRRELKPTTPENLRYHAEEAMRVFDDKMEGSITQSEEYLARKKYLGEYPPKKLENL